MSDKISYIDNPIEYKRLWRQKHAEHLKEYNKKYMREYYHANTEKFKESNKIRNTRRVNCECGTSVCYYGMKNHLKTKKHNDLLKTF